MWTAALVLLLAPLALLAVAALYVDDWSRDLTTNVARTDPEAADASLRPIEIDRTRLAERIDALVKSGRRWSRAEDPRPLPSDSPLASIPGADAASHLVHSTALVGYADDVWIVSEPLGEGRVRVHAESRSRVGKGDLGQNPRNLRSLLEWIAGG